MAIQRINEQIVITLPGTMEIESLQRLINSLLYKEASKDSQAKQEDVDKLAREANRVWREENKQ